ncbi:hypothetical protein [Marinomonas atlantica]|uniref:hypothetical protein n=1 Tax=Marinomonas atlantica TaxID=1806668 RepID=UPI0009EE31CC|nr:hypothetical protein [Marinomonas atlantica]
MKILLCTGLALVAVAHTGYLVLNDDATTSTANVTASDTDVTTSTADVSSSDAETLCQADESVSFSCDTNAKTVSVCRNTDDKLVYRFGNTEQIEKELVSEVNFSRTAYSGGGEGHLTFTDGDYRYVVYSVISNGEWQDDGTREKETRGGIYVLKGDQVLNDIQCQNYSGKPTIHNLPAYEEEPFEYFD